MLVVEDSNEDALIEIRALRAAGFEPAWERVETPATKMRKVLDERAQPRGR